MTTVKIANGVNLDIDVIPFGLCKELFKVSARYLAKSGFDVTVLFQLKEKDTNKAGIILAALVELIGSDEFDTVLFKLMSYSSIGGYKCDETFFEVKEHRKYLYSVAKSVLKNVIDDFFEVPVSKS